MEASDSSGQVEGEVVCACACGFNIFSSQCNFGVWGSNKEKRILMHLGRCQCL